MSKTIDIIFLTWNRLELNKKSLIALLNSDPDIDYNVYIHDNGSTDGTSDWLKTLTHPKIKDINFNKENVGISPVTNKFWDNSKAEIIGKIDNDLIVPKGWIKSCLSRLEDPIKDKVGPVTLYHWIDEWADDIDFDKSTIVTMSNGKKMVRSTHTGGNYLMHRYLIDKYGRVNENQGLKGGFTTWQYQFSRDIICGYVYPIETFCIPELYKAWEKFKVSKVERDGQYWMNKERSEAKRLLEIKL